MRKVNWIAFWVQWTILSPLLLLLVYALTYRYGTPDVDDFYVRQP
jgi:hypothetical protein